MTDRRSGPEIAHDLDHGAEEMEGRLHRLEHDLDDAQDKADERRRDVGEGGSVLGNAEDLGPGAGFGQDAEGAAENPDRD